MNTNHPTNNIHNAEALADDIEKTQSGIIIPRPVKHLGSGFRSTVIRDASGQVFRIGRTSNSVGGYKHEVKLLQFLRNQLPTAIPEPRLFAPRSEQFPGGVMTYRELPGHTLSTDVADEDSWGSLATELGEFLATLHQIPTTTLQELKPQPSHSTIAELEKTRIETTPTLKNRLSTDEMSRINRWWDELFSAPEMHEYSPVLIHNDFWHKNILVRSNPPKLSGVIDWEHSRLGDPVIDLVAVRYLGDKFARQVRAAYSNRIHVDPINMNFRLERQIVLREFGGIGYSISHNDNIELDASIEKLRNTGVTGISTGRST
ncbi:MAG: phosphotransferase [Chloroflexi bacterium]|jgi:aminoglycoside phosphotransferase (APT) family kinase protein|nr:phosphotransferase [Chloroflexota bacterium]